MKRLFPRIALMFAAVGLLLAFTIPFAPTANACAVGETPYKPTGSTKADDRLCCPTGYENSATSCVMGKYINPAIRLLAYIAGVAVIGGIIWGGIQYGSSAGDAQKVVKGKQTITKALVGLVTFLLLASFIQFMSPVAVTQGTGASCKRQFLGLKTWYAYVPNDQINPNTCAVSQDLPILPTKDKPGILPAVALAIVDDLLRISAYVAVAFVITGGIQYATSQGEPSRTKQAMSTILNALIGLAIAVVASVIVAFLGRVLTQ